MRFAQYIALGDSISIDVYPLLDLRARLGDQVSEAVGAASLLHRNRDELWPEFSGRDLVSGSPGLRFRNLASDGATTLDILNNQIPVVSAERDEPTLVTITAGGNDLLGILGAAASGLAALDGLITGAEARLRQIVDAVRRAVPQAQIVLSTVYDPSDGTGVLDDGIDIRRGLPLLERFNQEIARIARQNGCLLADLHAHFRGHGVKTPSATDRWYWPESIIEPGAKGASEIRRVWLSALEAPG